jgi:hypothetical protein
MNKLIICPLFEGLPLDQLEKMGEETYRISNGDIVIFTNREITEEFIQEIANGLTNSI